MASQKVVIEGSSAVTASQLKDFFRQIADGSLNGEQVQAILERKNPFAEPVWPAPVEPRKLLESVATAALASVESFVAVERFVVDTGKKAPVKLGWLGDNFKEHFLPKVETQIEGTEVKISKLLEASLDPPIINALGGEEKAETSLAHLYALLLLQPKGQKGKLLTNGYANIFYIRDAKGVLWAVRARWDDIYDYWHVEANPVSRPNAWNDGGRVVSR